MSNHYRYRISEPSIGTAEVNATIKCLAAGELTQAGGHSVATFESRLAALLSVDPERVIACGSGTSALHLVLLALGIDSGDRVAVPSLTYVATVAALRYVGAEPVFVDVDPHTWTLDPLALHKLAGDVSAVIPVDLYGVSALDNLDDLDKLSHLTIIRDACQSLGGPFDPGHPAVFSFYANKLITTGGEGGAVVATSRQQAAEARRFRGQGQSVNRRYWHEVVGYNYRMTAMQAAFGTAQLSQVNDFLTRRKAVADVYRTELAKFKYQRGPAGSASVDWLFSLLVPYGVDRDQVGRYLANIHGIETRPVFPSVAKMPPYHQWDTDLPVTDDIAARGISLPTHPQLTPADASTIARAFIDAVNSPSTKKEV